jgi:hypothetical protein
VKQSQIRIFNFLAFSKVAGMCRAVYFPAVEIDNDGTVPDHLAREFTRDNLSLLLKEKNRPDEILRQKPLTSSGFHNAHIREDGITRVRAVPPLYEPRGPRFNCLRLFID